MSLNESQHPGYEGIQHALIACRDELDLEPLELSFLTTIAENPQDQTTRFVYADWLEERSNPIAEFIRVEEEMRDLPVFSDRYWELRERRHWFQDRVLECWSIPMGYTTNESLLFTHGFPDGWKERWRLIREFAEHWIGGRFPSTRSHTEEIAALESELEIFLPPSLREWIGFHSDLRRASLSSRFPYNDHMRHLELISLLWLYTPKESAMHLWGVRFADLVNPDPPMMAALLARTFTNTIDLGIQAEPAANSVTEFVLASVFLAAEEVGGFRRTGVDEREVVPLLAANFPIHCEIGPHIYFEAPHLLGRVTRGADGEGDVIAVKIAKLLPREAIPDVLFEYAQHADLTHGIFGDING